jgi:type 1 glutamine amidotransferase
MPHARYRIAGILIALTVACALRPARAAEPATKPARALNVVVITGGHAFDAKAFPKLFDGYDDIHPTFVALKAYTEIFEDIHDWKYDVIVFYNMTQIIPENRRAHFLALLERGVGVVSLHHNIWAYQDWPEFAKIIGGKQFAKPSEFDGKTWPQSTYRHDTDFKVHVEQANHPITAGIADFAIRDESYHGLWLDPAATVLLTTDAPTSDRPLAWCKTYAQSRTCCIQLGHGPGIFTDANYRRVVSQAIRWSAGEAR